MKERRKGSAFEQDGPAKESGREQQDERFNLRLIKLRHLNRTSSPLCLVMTARKSPIPLSNICFSSHKLTRMYYACILDPFTTSLYICLTRIHLKQTFQCPSSRFNCFVSFCCVRYFHLLMVISPRFWQAHAYIYLHIRHIRQFDSPVKKGSLYWTGAILYNGH